MSCKIIRYEHHYYDSGYIITIDTADGNALVNSCTETFYSPYLSYKLTYNLKYKFVNLHNKMGIWLTQKSIFYVCKIPFKLLNIYLGCQFHNTHYSVYFLIIHKVAEVCKKVIK